MAIGAVNLPFIHVRWDDIAAPAFLLVTTALAMFEFHLHTFMLKALQNSPSVYSHCCYLFSRMVSFEETLG